MLRQQIASNAPPPSAKMCNDVAMMIGGPNSELSLRPAVTIARGAAWLVAASLWLYAFLFMVWLVIHWPESAAISIVTCWAPAPADIVLLLAIASLLYGGVADRLQRIAWWLLFTGAAVDLAATVATANVDATSPLLYRELSDWLYLPYYPLNIGAFALFFLSSDGSFRRPQLWLDAITILLGVLATLWTFLYEAPLGPGAGIAMGVAAKLSYTLATSAAITMAGLLFIQIGDWRREPCMMLLIGAAVAGLGSDTVWLAHDAAGSAADRLDNNIGYTIFSIGDIVYCAFVTSAAAAARRVSAVSEAQRRPLDNTYSFLPALALLLAIALLVGSEATQRGLDKELLIGLVLLGALLLVARQRGVRHELRSLNQALAKREAEARLTELVRCSADVIAVVNAQQELGFVSPAAEAMLGIRAADLENKPAVRMLGTAHEARMAAFLAELRDRPGASAEMETSIMRQADHTQVIRVIGSNQLANPHINGITVTLSDISEQRALERELLSIATRERLRLCSDIHEGLGQELTGIALLLQSCSTQTVRDQHSHQKSLREIAGYINAAIDNTRKLALGLSPVHVVGNSLSTALQRLAASVSNRVDVRVDFETASDDPRIDDDLADHLYRVAQESISNAIRHSRCTVVKVALRVAAGWLTLEVRDDGIGFDSAPASRRGLGLRMMEYRARVAGGTLRLERPIDGGTSVVITVPCRPAPA
jgi:PAS domain S-box-containing protein